MKFVFGYAIGVPDMHRLPGSDVEPIVIQFYPVDFFVGYFQGGCLYVWGCKGGDCLSIFSFARRYLHGGLPPAAVHDVPEEDQYQQGYCHIQRYFQEFIHYILVCFFALIFDTNVR
jgi:hypothetical protein